MIDVISMGRNESFRINRRDKQCLYTAVVKIDNGQTLHVSRFNDETEWVIDSLYNKNGQTIYENKPGCRSRITDVIPFKSELSNALYAKEEDSDPF